MLDIERFIEKKLNPVHKAYYATWVYWWSLWRSLYSRGNILRKWEQVHLIQPGQTLLDYGCGTGDFAIPAASLLGSRGKVYALDCFRRQLEIVKEKSRKKGLTNIETILSNRQTGLPDECIDVIWMCDVFHEVIGRRAVLTELHRILKNGGVLAIYDGMREGVLGYTNGLFSLVERDGKLCRFAKIK